LIRQRKKPIPRDKANLLVGKGLRIRNEGKGGGEKNIHKKKKDRKKGGRSSKGRPEVATFQGKTRHTAAE